MFYAIQSGDLKCIQYLIDSGADLELRKDSDSDTPIERAIYKGNIEVVKLLLKNGVNVDEHTIYYAEHVPISKDEEIIKLIKQYKTPFKTKFKMFGKKIKNAFNESLLDNIEGPSKEEVLNSLNIKGDSIDECFEYIIKESVLNPIDDFNDYYGDDVETSITRLLQACDYDVKKAEHGIVFLDECFDGNTEVMTENGFIPFKDLTDSTKIMQWNSDNTMSLVNSERIVKHKCLNGLLSLQNSKTGQIIHTSTPNHNRVVISHGKYRDKYIIKKVIAEKSLNQGYDFPVTGIFDGNNIDISDDMLKFIVAFAADGCIKNGKYGYLTVKKERKYNRLNEILNNLHIKYTYTFNEKNSYHNFYFGDISNMPFFKDGKKK
jgi:hypothetical protein